MPPKGSSSQASSLVQRGAGGSSAGAGAVAPRQQAAVGARRRSTRVAGGKQTGYFVSDDTSIFQLSPDQVLYFAIGFIIVVFILHIVGKLRGA